MCLDAPRTHTLVPCGHAILCEGCAAELKQRKRWPSCPLCSKRSTSIIRIHP